MAEFTTEYDIHAIMSYKRHEQDKLGDYSAICVDIDALAAINEGYCKLLGAIYLDDALNGGFRL